MPMKRITAGLTSVLILLFSFTSYPQSELDNCNITWNSQSKNSGESMPCGGGDIGLNVWVENGELFFYIAKSGAFDENNSLLKLGRVRIKLSPNPFDGQEFQQQLVLKEGRVNIKASNGKLTANISIWVDVFRPVINVDINSNQVVTTEATYESWRYKDRMSSGRANNANSYKWAAQGEVKTFADHISLENNAVLFYHQNNSFSVFDITVKQQGLDSVKAQLFNPLKNLVFGGMMQGKNMVADGETHGTYLNTDFKGWKLRSAKAARAQQVNIFLNSQQANSVEEWKNNLNTLIKKTVDDKTSAKNTSDWWNTFWQRSFIFINGANKNDTSSSWQTGRNYQLFRYMLACNASGEYPTKFNGGLFTYDPSLVDTSFSYTPDFRNWGGGIHTAQNQRLVYFPMLKNGDFDLLKAQFDLPAHSA